MLIKTIHGRRIALAKEKVEEKVLIRDLPSVPKLMGMPSESYYIKYARLNVNVIPVVV